MVDITNSTPLSSNLTNSNQLPKVKINRWKKIILLIFGLLFLPYLVFSFFTTTGIANILMMVYCGKQPVKATSFMSGFHFTLPGEMGYDTPTLGGIYFCSREDAEKAGYRHSPSTALGR